MSREGRILIKKEIDDEFVNRLKTFDAGDLLKEKEGEISSLNKNISRVVEKTQKLYKKDKTPYISESAITKDGLYPIQEAYDFLINNGMKISFRAFGGRVERQTLPSFKVGRKRYIHLDTLNHLLKQGDEFYSVRDAFERYNDFEPNLNLRAFIGRVEKGSIPSIKLGTKRLIPKVVIDSMTEVRKNYFTVPEALGKLKSAGIKIRRSAFERRLDRKRVPFVKISGKRYIPSDVVGMVIDKEIQNRARKK